MRSRDGRAMRAGVDGRAHPHARRPHAAAWSSIFRDITGEQKREEELQKASRLESVALVAGRHRARFQQHPHGHPRASLTGQNRAPCRRRWCFGTIEKACFYATDLTRQLLTFAKGAPPNRRLEALAELVREGVEFALHGSTMRCCFDLPEGLPSVEVDRNQIHQVLNNLVINAVQAASQRGVLQVAAREVAVSREQPVATLPPGLYVEVSLRDNGTGIAPEHLARIFDPYFTTKSTGSGLGLATAYSIIKKHDGLIQRRERIGAGHDVFDLPARGRAGARAVRAADYRRAHARPGSGACGGWARALHGRRGGVAGTRRGDAGLSGLRGGLRGARRGGVRPLRTSEGRGPSRSRR